MSYWCKTLWLPLQLSSPISVRISQSLSPPLPFAHSIFLTACVPSLCLSFTICLLFRLSVLCSMCQLVRGEWLRVPCHDPSRSVQWLGFEALRRYRQAKGLEGDEEACFTLRTCQGGERLHPDDAINDVLKDKDFVELGKDGTRRGVPVLFQTHQWELISKMLFISSHWRGRQDSSLQHDCVSFNCKKSSRTHVLHNRIYYWMTLWIFFFLQVLKIQISSEMWKLWAWTCLKCYWESKTHYIHVLTLCNIIFTAVCLSVFLSACLPVCLSDRKSVV